MARKDRWKNSIESSSGIFLIKQYPIRIHIGIITKLPTPNPQKKKEVRYYCAEPAQPVVYDDSVIKEDIPRKS